MPINYKNLPTLILDSIWDLHIKPFNIFGSRAFNIADDNSDYDVYTNIKDLDLFALKQYKITKNGYINTPKYGDTVLFTNVPAYTERNKEYITMDILAFTDDRDIEIVSNVLAIMQSNVTYYSLFEQKLMRITLFTYGLHMHGFTLSKHNKELLQNTIKQNIDIPTIWGLLENGYKHSNSNENSMPF